MGFFHALYVIVYTSTTIGFGEIPYEWTNNQRLWIMISSIIGVVLWVYAMGRIITLSQNKVFKDHINEYRFENQVEKLKKPFYIVIGYGVTGKHILKLFKTNDLNVVILDKEEHVFENLDNDNFKQNIPYLVANGRNVEVLKKAGIHMPNCKGAMIVSGNEDDNVKIAITIKLLEPKKQILVRADKFDNINNLQSFETDHIISAEQIFSKELFLLLNRQEEYNLKQKLNNAVKKFEYAKKIPEGKWIICGYNDLTKKIITHLINNNIDFKIITKKTCNNKLLQPHFVMGEGVAKNNLSNAGIEDASVIFGATDDDFKNLSTIITAKHMNPNIYSISIQNKSYREDLFENANVDLIFRPQYTVATKVYSLISEPYLNTFYQEISKLDLKKVRTFEVNLNKNDLETWHFRINNEKSFYHLIPCKIIIEDIIPHGHNIRALMVQKENNEIVLEPELDYVLEENDVILFSGKHDSFCRQQLLMYNINVYDEYQYRKNKEIK